MLTAAKSWPHLSNLECTRAYAKQFVTGHGDLILISPSLDATAGAMKVGYFGQFQKGYVAFRWMCMDWNCTNGNQPVEAVTQAPWVIEISPYDGGIVSLDLTIEGCRSSPVEEHCSVQFSVVIMSIVILANALKAVCMLLTLKQTTSLVTIGDALQSFLRENDHNTIGMCLAGRADFQKRIWQGSQKNRSFGAKRHFWFAGASLGRWLSCNIL